MANVLKKMSQFKVNPRFYG